MFELFKLACSHSVAFFSCLQADIAKLFPTDTLVLLFSLNLCVGGEIGLNMTNRVLVIGGSYFIGKKIVSILCDKDYNVTILNRGSRKAPAGVNTIIADRNNLEEMRTALSDHTFDYVIDVSGLNKEQVKITHDALAQNVFHSIKKYIFISSSAVYNLAKCNIPIKESSPLGENQSWKEYGTDKIEAESFLSDSYRNTGIKLVFLRPPYVYGEDNYAQRESFIFNHIINGEKIIIPGGGITRIQFIYSGDLAQIVSAILEKELDSDVSVFNVGNKQALSFNKWISACSQVAQKKASLLHFDYGKHGYNVRDFFPFYDNDLILDVSDISNIYDHETDFITGLECAYNWFLENRESICFKPEVSENEKKILNLPLLNTNA